MENISDTQGVRVVAYFDVDCFYAQSEVLRRPHLQGRPVGVTQKFLVVTCNYEARQRGVPKMASIQTAKERCPDLVLFNGEDLTPYRTASKNIMTVLGRFGVLERRGLDEAALDITSEVMKRSAFMPRDMGFEGHVLGQTNYKENGDALHLGSSSSDCYLMLGSQLVSEIRAAVERETGFRCSSGIATNKMLAKLVSSVNKPNQQTCILESAISGFLTPLSVRKLPGIGHQTESLLKGMGITTVADLQQSTLEELSNKFGNRLGTILFDNCRGIDSSVVQDKGPPKSLSVEDSFQPCTTFNQAEVIIRSLAPDLIARLDEDKDEYSRRPKVFTIKWRYPGNWAFRSSSATMPDELLLPSIPVEKRLETLVEIAMKLLSQSLGKQSFSIVVLNIGATSFTAANANGSNCASHDIRSFLRSPLQSPQKVPSKVVSKREARFHREECEKGRLGVKLAHSVIDSLDNDSQWQDYNVQTQVQAIQEVEREICKGEDEGTSAWKVFKLCSSAEQTYQETGEPQPSTSYTAPSLLGEDQESEKNASEVTSSDLCGIIHPVEGLHEAGSVGVRNEESVTAAADYHTSSCDTSVYDVCVQDFESFTCRFCGQEVQGDVQSKQEHDDYHYALKLNSQEQRLASVVASKPSRSKHMASKTVLHHHASLKRAKIQSDSKSSQCATLDCFFFPTQD